MTHPDSASAAPLLGRTVSAVPERGCDYCRSELNLFYGHVEQVASNEARRTVLLRCPKCGWLYEDDLRKEPVHVGTDDPREWFEYAPDG